MAVNRPKPASISIAIGAASILLALLVAVFVLRIDTARIEETSDTTLEVGTCTPTTVIYSGDATAANFPARAALPGAGDAVVVTGSVRDLHCAAVGGATIRYWAAGTDGAYGPDSYGSVRSNSDGSYQFATFYPGSYPGAQPHVHISVHIDGVEVRTELHPIVGTTNYTLDLIPPHNSAASDTPPDSSGTPAAGSTGGILP